MRNHLSWTPWVLLVSACIGTPGMPVDPGLPERTALVLLDLQRDFLEDSGRLPVDRSQVEPMVSAVLDLHARARAAGVPVVRVHNAFDANDPGNVGRNHAAIAGTPGAEADPRVALDHDAAFDKQASDAFTNDELDAWVRSEHITRLVIVGVYADQCVVATSWGARNRGMDVVVPQDGVGANSGAARERAVAMLRLLRVEVPARARDVVF